MSRHANTGRKLSRNTSHRKALLDNLIRAVILEESIRTTTPKAKEARRVVERVITKAKANTLAARAKLFETIGPRFKARPGGYTRIIHTQNRLGDNAPMSILELVEKSEKAAPEQKASPEKKGEEKKTEAASSKQGAGEKKAAKQKKPKADEGEKKE